MAAPLFTSQPMAGHLKGELNPKIKLHLNDSFCTLINKYNPHIF